MKPIFEQINGAPEETFHEGFRFYDEGFEAGKSGKPFNQAASLSWQDGWCDYWETLNQG